MAVAQVVVGTLGAIAPGIVSSILHSGTTQVSLLVLAPAAVGMVIGAVLLGHFFSRNRKSNLIKVGIYSVSIALMLYSGVDFFAGIINLPTILLSLGMLVVLGIFNAFFDIPVNTIVQENTPEEVRSRVYGVIAALTGGAGVLPILAVGAVADLFGVKIVVFLLGVVLLGIVLLSNFSSLEKP
jgi:MFS family permease